MDPERDGYISLEEEPTISSQQCADSPKEEEPHGPRPAEDDAALSDGSTAELVEAGVPEEPCFYGHGPAWDNRHWRGWKPRDTPRMPPKGTVSAEKQQSNSSRSHAQVTGQPQPPPRGIDHEEFCKDLNGMPLPCDDAERANFDQQDVFILGDPAASFDRSGSHNYDRKSSNPLAGFPEWKMIFSYILRDCGYLVDYDTVYVLVDTRDLADHAARDPGLPHWQAAVAWWESRLQMTGPMGERTELCFFPASEHTGLHNVHPTWAGTFVLAALGASFPGKHFFLLDSDCLPVTLFEAFDIWQEAYLTRFPLGAEESRKLPHPLLQYQRFQHDCYVKDTREGTSHQKMGQGVVLVTEPHAELNAGFVGLFASKHPAIFNWAQWNAETKHLNQREEEERCSQTAGILTSAYWTLVSQYLCRRLSPHELSPEASKAWIQTGLALSPLFGTVAQHSIDVIIAWALIGEWSSRVLFPPPEGQWPRHGHPQCIGEFYVQRAPSLTAWARACFEQGALAPLLYLPGIVPVFTLPGDRMFQSTGIHTNVQRPVILHAYGGAKVHMESALQTLRLQGWIPMASALVGTDTRPPLWVTNDLRVTAGTSLDLILRPHPLTPKRRFVALIAVAKALACS